MRPSRRAVMFLNWFSAGLFTPVLSLLLERGFWALLPALVPYGVARAVASGSLDALFIEECLRSQGEGALSSATGQLSLCQTLGLAAGARLLNGDTKMKVFDRTNRICTALVRGADDG